jgi:hypothetical protein
VGRPAGKGYLRYLVQKRYRPPASPGLREFRGEHTMHDIPDQFVDAPAFELRLRGVPVLRSELRTWLRDVAPLVAEDPCVSAWASRWLEMRPAFAEGAD